MTALERELRLMNRTSQVSFTRRMYRKGRDFFMIMRSLPALSGQTGKSIWVLGRTALNLWHFYGFTPKEIRNNGIIHSSNPDQAARKRISKRALVALQARLNPVQLEGLTEDKSIFHTLLEAHKLASIPTLALFYRGCQGRTIHGYFPCNEAQWLEALRQCLPLEFVVKPARGALGAGVRVFRRSADQLTCLATGEITSLQELIARLTRDTYFPCYLFQERLINHPAIAALSGSPALQTVRIVTLLGSDDQVEILFARLRLVSGNTYTDNFRAGEAGSMLAQVHLDTGRVFETIQRSDDGRYQSVQRHPVTSVELDGFEMPFWQDMRRLVTQGARAFSPVRVLGWDVACTETGPVLVEANCRWDPPNECDREMLIQRLVEETCNSGEPLARGAGLNMRPRMINEC